LKKKKHRLAYSRPQKKEIVGRCGWRERGGTQEKKKKAKKKSAIRRPKRKIE